MSSPIDELDARIIALMAAEPRIGLMEISRRLSVARGTVQARLTKLTDRGVIKSFGPEVDPSPMGYPVLAFVYIVLAVALSGRAPPGPQRPPDHQPDAAYPWRSSSRPTPTNFGSMLRCTPPTALIARLRAERRPYSRAQNEVSTSAASGFTNTVR